MALVIVSAHLTAKKALKYRFLRDFAERQNLVRPAPPLNLQPSVLCGRR